MSMTANTPPNLRTSQRKDGVIGLWGRMFYRDPDAYEAWLRERDMIIITAALMRLSERQLNRLGMSHGTLALDVEDLTRQAQRNEQLTADILQLVASDDSYKAIAAE